MSVRDHGLEVLKKSGERVNSNSQADMLIKVMSMSGPVPTKYDRWGVTYVSSGNGEGEVETIFYQLGAGNTVRTLTFAYNSDDEVISCTPS